MLTDAKVRAAKPRAKPYKLTDANRLYLLVTPSGGKLWRWNYDYDGKQKSMAFGAYPLVSLADARSKRDEAYSVLCEGRDPNVAKRLKIEENIEAGRQTFERVARLRDHCKSRRSLILFDEEERRCRDNSGLRIMLLRASVRGGWTICRRLTD